MDQSGNPQNRRSRRSPVLLTANIEVDGAPVPVKLRNLSEQGALIEGEKIPPEGSATIFERKELRLKGRVIWVQGRYAGVAFDRPLKPDEVLRHVPTPKRPVQNGDFRRPGLACRPLSDYERKMLEVWMTSSPVGTLGE